tara:strand:+ start:19 stop:894 length:876 start_codon:yes stop_codon:yes gene_type:complete
LPSPPPEAEGGIEEAGGSAISSDDGDGGTTAVIILGVSAALLLLGCVLGAVKVLEWVHTRTAMLNALHEAPKLEPKRPSTVARIEDDGPLRTPAGATPLSTNGSVVWAWTGAGEPTQQTSPPRASIQRSSSMTLAMSKQTSAPRANVQRSSSMTLAMMSKPPKASEVAPPITQPGAATPFATVRQGQSDRLSPERRTERWLTQQSDPRLSPERRTEAPSSAEVGAAQAEAASSAGLSDPRPQEVEPPASQAAGLELPDSPKEKLPEMGTEELRVEEKMMRARAYESSMFRV